MRRLLLLLLTAIVFASGCADDGDDPSDLDSTTPTSARGRPAVVVTTTTTIAATGPGATPAKDASDPRSSTTAPTPTARAGRVDDPAGDAGAAAATYADLRAVEIGSRGDTLVVTVTLAGAIPARLPAGEVEGVGVDLFTASSSEESDWQLFADGEPDGWYGYLDGPDGPTALPGTLTVDGDALVFELPWSAVTDPASGTFSAYVDWSRDGVPTNTVTSDHAPDTARTEFRRP